MTLISFSEVNQINSDINEDEGYWRIVQMMPVTNRTWARLMVLDENGDPELRWRDNNPATFTADHVYSYREVLCWALVEDTSVMGEDGRHPRSIIGMTNNGVSELVGGGDFSNYKHDGYQTVDPDTESKP